MFFRSDVIVPPSDPSSSFLFRNILSSYTLGTFFHRRFAFELQLANLYCVVGYFNGKGHIRVAVILHNLHPLRHHA
jgi:hypothetical protein